MKKYRQFLFKLILLYLTSNFNGCFAMNCENYTAANLRVKNGYDFRIRKTNGDYWGSLTIYMEDRSLGYTDNSFFKFRNDLDDFEYIKYKGDDEEGHLLIKFPRDKKAWCVCRMPRSYWDELLDFVDEWEESKLFITEEK